MLIDIDEIKKEFLEECQRAFLSYVLPEDFSGKIFCKFKKSKLSLYTLGGYQRHYPYTGKLKALADLESIKSKIDQLKKDKAILELALIDIPPAGEFIEKKPTKPRQHQPLRD